MHHPKTWELIRVTNEHEEDVVRFIDSDKCMSMRHCELNMAQYCCKGTYGKLCDTDERLRYAYWFTRLDQMQRMVVSHGNLFPLSSLKTMINEAMRSNDQQLRMKQKIKITENKSTAYLVLSERIRTFLLRNCAACLCGNKKNRV